jgi:hypothetical protein
MVIGMAASLSAGCPFSTARIRSRPVMAQPFVETARRFNLSYKTNEIWP